MVFSVHTALTAALVLTICGSARAQTVNPAWLVAIEPEMPAFAALMGVDGYAQLGCIARETGTLTDCVVEEEVPAGLGFGEAALDATFAGRMRPKTVDGVPKPARVTFRARFTADMGTAAPPPAYAGPEPSSEALDVARRIVREVLPSRADAFPSLFRLRDPEATARLEAVHGEVMADLGARGDEIVALGIARAVPLDQLRARMAGQPHNFPAWDEVERATFAEAFDWNIEVAKRLRAVWCARYGPCPPRAVETDD